MSTELVGVFNKLWISPGAADSGTYTQVEFNEGSSLGLEEQFLDSNGMTGSRFRIAARTRAGTRQVRGQLQCNPTPAELDIYLAWATGATKTSNKFDLTPGGAAESIPSRYIRVDRNGYIFLYTANYIASYGFSATEGQMLNLSLGLEGTDETTSTDPTSPTGIDTASGPYVMTDCVLTVGGTAYDFRQFDLQIDNALDVRFNNSITPSSIKSTGCNVQLRLGMPLGASEALYGSALAGVDVVATFTNSINSKSFTIEAFNAQAPRTPLELGTRRMLTLNWAATVRQGGSNPLIRFTNAS